MTLCLMANGVQAQALITDSTTTVDLDSLTGGPSGLVNQGVTVDVTNGEALRATNQQWQIDNAGTLRSSDSNTFAVRLTNGSAFNNAPMGIVSGVGGGFTSINSATEVKNFGLIEATVGTGIDMRAGGGIENKTGAVIRGGDYGVHLQNSSDQLINEGKITATNTSGTSTGVYLNGGTVRVRNIGSISGTLYGIQLANGNQSITNVGTIEAVSGGVGVGTGVQFTTGGTLTNLGGASISGGQYGVWTQNGSAQITTAGLISGGTNSVVFSTGNGILTLQTGAQLIGAALGGGSSQIILQGSGSARNDFLNFGSLDMTGDEWTLLGNTQAKVATVSNGRLFIGSPGYSGAELDTTTTTINSGTQLIGYNSRIHGDVTNKGQLYVGSGYAFPGSPAVSSLYIEGTLENTGAIILSKGAPYGNTLNVTGSYDGAGGTLTVGASLNPANLGPLDNQRADRLLIGGSAGGSTRVIPIVSSDTAATASLSTRSLIGSRLFAISSRMLVSSELGVSLVQVAGGSTENAFTMNGYVTGGTPFQYKLYAFGPGSTYGPAAPSQNLVDFPNSYWDYRLERAFVTAIPLPPGDIGGIIIGGGGGTGGTGGGGSGGGGGGGSSIIDQGRWQVVPQLPGYLTLASALFNTGMQDIDSLHRRLGEIRDVQATKGLTTEAETFVRVYGGPSTYKTDLSFGHYGFDADVDYTAVQLGGSAVMYSGDKSVIRLGGALTIGYSETDPDSPLDGRSTTKTDTQSGSLIATYLHQSGFYADAILSMGNIDAKTTTETYGNRTVASIDGTSYAASLEVGYPFALWSSGFNLEPQLQYVWQKLNFDRFTDIDGIRTDLGNPTENIIRVGFRLTRPFETASGDPITPYFKVNYLQSIGNSGDIMAGSYIFPMGSYGKTLQVGGGITGMINKHLAIYADAAWQDTVGDNGWRGWQFNGGLRYSFGDR